MTYYFVTLSYPITQPSSRLTNGCKTPIATPAHRRTGGANAVKCMDAQEQPCARGKAIASCYRSSPASCRRTVHPVRPSWTAKVLKQLPLLLTLSTYILVGNAG